MLIPVVIANVAALVFAIIVLIDAFEDEIWKGFVGILCGLYLLYYAFVEFEHERKWLIVGGLVVSSAAAAYLGTMSPGGGLAQ